MQIGCERTVWVPVCLAIETLDRGWINAKDSNPSCRRFLRGKSIGAGPRARHTSNQSDELAPPHRFPRAETLFYLVG